MKTGKILRQELDAIDLKHEKKEKEICDRYDELYDEHKMLIIAAHGIYESRPLLIGDFEPGHRVETCLCMIELIESKLADNPKYHNES